MWMCRTVDVDVTVTTLSRVWLYRQRNPIRARSTVSPSHSPPHSCALPLNPIWTNSEISTHPNCKACRVILMIFSSQTCWCFLRLDLFSMNSASPDAFDTWVERKVFETWVEHKVQKCLRHPDASSFQASDVKWKTLNQKCLHDIGNNLQEIRSVMFNMLKVGANWHVVTRVYVN